MLKDSDGGMDLKFSDPHETIFPCTLPPWLPKDILEKMVSTFGEQLKVQLEVILQENQVTERRSVDSIPFSMTACSDYDEYVEWEQSLLAGNVDQLDDSEDW